MSVVLIALVGAIGGSVSAGAAPTPVTYEVTGSFAIATTLEQGPIVLASGSTFTATPDPRTGVFTDGKFTIPSSGNVQIGITTITNPGSATGRVDPVSGVMVITGQMQIAFDYDIVGTCTYGPFEVDLSSLNAGGANFSSHPGKATLTQQGYAVPAGTGNGTDLTNKPCGGTPASTTHTSVAFTLTEPGGEPTTTTPPSKTTMASAPQAVASNPGFTG